MYSKKTIKRKGGKEDRRENKGRERKEEKKEE